MPKSEIPVENLIQQLHDADWEKRCEAARLLGLSKDERAVEALLPDLDDPDWKVRRNAVQALGALKSKRAVEPLVQALKDRTITVRQRAVVALGRIKDPETIPVLIQALLRNDNEHVSHAAFQALRKFGRKAEPCVIEALRQTPDIYLIDLLQGSRMPEEAKLLIDLVGNENQMIRLRAISALGRLQDPKVIEFLMVLLKREEPAIKPAVVKSLGALHATQAAPKFLEMLQKHSAHGPGSAIYHSISEAFQDMSGIKAELENAFPRKFPSLLNIDATGTSLPEAIGSLDDEHIQMLNEMLAKMEDRMREVGKMVELPPDLVQNFSERTWQFGAMFADARDARAERVKLLLDLLICQSPLKRAAAALTLPLYADSQALGPLEEAMHDEDEIVRQASRCALAALTARLNARGHDTPPPDIKGLFGS